MYTDRGEREKTASERSIERQIDSTWISAAYDQEQTEPDIHKVPVMCSHEWHCQSKIQEVQSSANSISPPRDPVHSSKGHRRVRRMHPSTQVRFCTNHMPRWQYQSSPQTPKLHAVSLRLSIQESSDAATQRIQSACCPPCFYSHYPPLTIR